MDNISLDAILYVGAKSAGRPELDFYNNAGCDCAPSKKFMRRMRRFIKRVRRQEAWAEWRSVTTAMKRIAVAAMLVCTVTLCGVLSVEAVQDAIWSTVVEWYDEYIDVVFVTEDGMEVPSEILEYKEPTAGLDGYERFEALRTTGMFVVEYEDEESMIAYEQSIVGDSALAITNENSTQHSVMLNGLSVDCFESEINGMILVTLVWNDGKYQYLLQGDVDIEKLLTIAESVK